MRHSIILKDQNYKGPISIDYREWGSHTQGVYDISHTVYLETGNSKDKARGRNRQE